MKKNVWSMTFFNVWRMTFSTSSLFFYTGFLTFTGIGIRSQEYAWVVVVLLPVKSALNPLIYMFSEILKWITRKPQVSFMLLWRVFYFVQGAKFVKKKKKAQKKVRLNTMFGAKDYREESRSSLFPSHNHIHITCKLVICTKKKKYLKSFHVWWNIHFYRVNTQQIKIESNTSCFLYINSFMDTCTLN